MIDDMLFIFTYCLVATSIKVYYLLLTNLCIRKERNFLERNDIIFFYTSLMKFYKLLRLFCSQVSFIAFIFYHIQQYRNKLITKIGTLTQISLPLMVHRKPFFMLYIYVFSMKSVYKILKLNFCFVPQNGLNLTLRLCS